MDTLAAFLNQLAALVPAVAFGAALIAVIVDGLKRIGLPDGYAPLASGLLNVALYVAVYFAGETHLDQVKSIVGALTLLAPIGIGLLGSLLAAPAIHEALTKRGIGFSHKAG